MWASIWERFTPLGFWHMGHGINLGLPTWACGLLAYGTHVGFWHMGRMWAAQIAPIVYVWCPFSPSGTQSSFAPWHPSGAHVDKVVLYLNLTYFWYLLTLGLVVTDCYLKYMYQTICEIDTCLIIEQNQHFVNVPNF